MGDLPEIWFVVAHSPDGPVIVMVTPGYMDPDGCRQAGEAAARRGIDSALEWISRRDIDRRYPGIVANHFAVIESKMRAIDPDWPGEGD